MPTSEQSAADGSGPHLERRYYVDFTDSRLSAPELMRYITAHVTDLAPDLLAEFEKVKGADAVLEVGHEFHIKILGPWNGSVRVTEVADDYFELCTLEGHPEAGHIRFSVQALDAPKGALRFEIHSKARSRDGLVAFAYSTLGVGKRVQEQTWVLFCEGVVKATEGQALGPVKVETIEQDETGTHAEGHTRG